jgi:hypothetical protein
MHREGPEVNAIQAEAGQKVNIERAHQLLGHMSEDSTRATAKALGWEIVRGSLQPCKSCSVGKAKQKNVPKKRNHIPAVKPGERLYLNVSSIKGEKDGPKVNPKGHWCIMVDERPISNPLISIKRGYDNTEWILTSYDVGEAYSVGGQQNYYRC